MASQLTLKSLDARVLILEKARALDIAGTPPPPPIPIVIPPKPAGGVTLEWLLSIPVPDETDPARVACLGAATYDDPGAALFAAAMGVDAAGRSYFFGANLRHSKNVTAAALQGWPPDAGDWRTAFQAGLLENPWGRPAATFEDVLAGQKERDTLGGNARTVGA